MLLTRIVTGTGWGGSVERLAERARDTAFGVQARHPDGLRAARGDRCADAARTLDRRPDLTRDQELWACALHVIRQHGDTVGDFIADRIEALARAGEAAGVDRWRAISACVDQLREGQVQ
jgi:hypothetical protein